MPRVFAIQHFRNRHRHVFFVADTPEDLCLFEKQLGKMIDDPELDFKWNDALAVLKHLARERQGVAP